MGRRYEIPFAEVSVSAVQDLFEILVPSDAVMIVHSLELSQSSDAADAEDEQLHISIRRVTGAPSSGSGGSTVTPAPCSPGDAAAGITAEINNTTQLSGGTNTLLYPVSWNVRGGYIYIPIPEGRNEFSPSTRCLIELETVPADALTMSGVLTVSEIGG